MKTKYNNRFYVGLMFFIVFCLFQPCILLSEGRAAFLKSVCEDLELHDCDRLAVVLSVGDDGVENISLLISAIHEALEKEKVSRLSIEKNQTVKYLTHHLVKAFLGKQRHFLCYEPNCDNRASDLEKQIELMKEAGLQFDQFKEFWDLQPTWLEDAASGNLDLPLVRQAFLEMTFFGWRGEFCAGTYTFHCVIAKGEEFLQKYPNSEISDQIRVELAQAYETWWSISVTNFEEAGYSEYPEYCGKREDYIPGSENARKQALKYYEVLKANPDIQPSGGSIWMSGQPKTVKERLQRIERGENTFQHRYWNCLGC